MKKLGHEFVAGWLAEHRPMFKPADGWVYENARARIHGTCRQCKSVAGSSWDRMSSGGWHCMRCARHVASVAATETRRSTNESRYHAAAADLGLTVSAISYRQRQVTHGYRVNAWVTFQCHQGHPKHEVRGDSLLAGYGCPACAVYGFNTDRESVLYLLARDKRGRQERQYGITNDLAQRMQAHRAHGWTLIDAWSGAGQDVLDVENEIKAVMKSEGIYRREFEDEAFTGWTEAWSSDHLLPYTTLRSLYAWVELSVDSQERTSA